MLVRQDPFGFRYIVCGLVYVPARLIFMLRAERRRRQEELGF